MKKTYTLKRELTLLMIVTSVCTLLSVCAAVFYVFFSFFFQKTQEDIEYVLRYTSQQYDFYVIGDLNSDEQVNSKDAAIMLSAYNIAEADGSLLTTANGKALMVSIAKMNPAKYKLDSAKKVEAADGNKDGRIMNCDDVNYSDVKQLLNYAAATGAGLTYDVAGWHYGEYVGYVK